MQASPDYSQNDRKTFLGAFYFVARTLACSLELYLHRGFGDRYFGLNTFAVIPAVLIFSTFWQGHDITPLLAFLGFYFVACLGARAGIAHRRRMGGVEHSYYNGRPFFLKWKLFRNMKERTAKGLEAFAMVLVGAFVMPLSEPLGSYLMVASLGLFASLAITAQYERQRDLDLQDALIDQQNAARCLRESGWRR